VDPKKAKFLDRLLPGRRAASSRVDLLIDPPHAVIDTSSQSLVES